MGALERRRDETYAEGTPGLGPSHGGSLEEARLAGEDFLAAGDQAIQQALSGDSEAFISQSRQEGGQ